MAARPPLFPADGLPASFPAARPVSGAADGFPPDFPAGRPANGGSADDGSPRLFASRTSAACRSSLTPAQSLEFLKETIRAAYGSDIPASLWPKLLG